VTNFGEHFNNLCLELPENPLNSTVDVALPGCEEVHVAKVSSSLAISNSQNVKLDIFELRFNGSNIGTSGSTFTAFLAFSHPILEADVTILSYSVRRLQ
jgi:hypothetical protein